MHIKIGGDTKQEHNLEDRSGASQASGSQQNELKLMILLLIRKNIKLSPGVKERTEEM